jgi:uncharacterized membrane protein (DUF2068 family)
VAHSKLAPEAEEHPTQLGVLRSIAAFEMAKGLVVLLAALGMVLLVQKEDPWDIADGLLRLLHISPDHRLAQLFLDWADSLTYAKLYAVAAVATAYSFLRFLEAYGLWYARAWAEWIALVSGALYLPFEIYNLAQRLSWVHVLVLAINLAIVLYMIYLLKTGKSHYQTLARK